MPDRLSVTGFTDLSFAALLPVPLTTVEKNAPELGLAAAHMLTELIADPSTRRQPLVIPMQEEGPIKPKDVSHSADFFANGCQRFLRNFPN